LPVGLLPTGSFRKSTMSDPKPATPNRRRGKRHQLKCSTKASCPKARGLGKDVAVSVLDLSETGIRLLVNEPLANGQEVEIILDSVITRKPLKVPGTIIWGVPAADGNHCIGVSFRQPVPYADMLKLVATF
jgi:hypothetical protein